MEKQNSVRLAHKLHSGWYGAPGRWKEGNIDLPSTVLDAFAYINIYIAVDSIYTQSHGDCPLWMAMSAPECLWSSHCPADSMFHLVQPYIPSRIWGVIKGPFSLSHLPQGITCGSGPQAWPPHLTIIIAITQTLLWTQFCFVPNPMSWIFQTLSSFQQLPGGIKLSFPCPVIQVSSTHSYWENKMTLVFIKQTFINKNYVLDSKVKIVN